MFTKEIFITCQASDNINIFSPTNDYAPIIKPAGDGPTGVAVDVYGNVIVTNIYSNSVTIYNVEDNYSRLDIAIGGAPIGVAVDYEGNIWVACSEGTDIYENGCVAKIDKESRKVTYYETYYKPFGIAVDAKGTVYTTHPEQKDSNDPWCVSKLSERLNYNYELITNLDSNPTGIAVDYNGHLWVSCANNAGNNGTLVKLTLTSEAQCLYGKLSYNVGKLPYGVSISRDEYVWVTNNGDASASSVKISDGNVTTYPCFATPQGISLDKDNNVWICNKELNKVTMLKHEDYTQSDQYDTGNYPMSFGDMTGVSVAYVVNHYKYLIANDSKIKTIEDNTLTEVSNSNTPTLVDFRDNGFIRLLDITDTIVQELDGNDFDILMWSDVMGNRYQIKSFAIPNHKLILQVEDIAIADVVNFNDIDVNVDMEGATSVVKLIVSTDEGVTWNAYDKNDGVWKTVDISDISNIKIHGMTPQDFNMLTTTDWDTILDDSKLLRFGYYLDLTDYSDDIRVDDLTMDINIKGYWKHIDNNSTDINYEIRSLSNLRVFIKTDGNYKINYTIMRNKGDIESNIDEWQQIDVIAPEGTSTSTPYVVDLSIPYTEDFRRREPHVLKFVPGTQNVIRTASDFDMSDNTKFTVLEDGQEVPGYQSKYVVWDGTMHFKTQYEIPMTDEGALGEGRVFSIQITQSEEGADPEDEYIGVIDSESGIEYRFKQIVDMYVG